jgi:hypothetical protein
LKPDTPLALLKELANVDTGMQTSGSLNNHGAKKVPAVLKLATHGRTSIVTMMVASTNG